jgi:chromosome segregation ATPase
MQSAMTRREREVWEACDDQWSQNMPFKKMTGDIIRDHLASLGYNKGSFTEIYKYRKTWEKSRNISLQNHSEQTPPLVPLTDPINRAVQHVREEIQAEAQVEIDNIREKAQQEVTDLTSRYQVLQKSHDDLYNSFEKMKLEQEKLQQDNVSLLEETSHFEIQIGKYETRVQMQEDEYKRFQSQKESQLAELKKITQQEIDRLQQQHEKTCAQYQQDVESLKIMIEEQRHQSIITIDQLKVSCQKLEVEIEKTRAHDKALRDWNQNLQQNLHQLQKEIKEKNAIHEQLKNAYQESQTLINQQDVKMNYLEKTVEQNQQAKEEEQKLIDLWKAKVDQLSTENIVLQTELNLLRSQISQERGAVSYGET